MKNTKLSTLRIYFSESLDNITNVFKGDKCVDVCISSVNHAQ